jgi:hypothetical protein
MGACHRNFEGIRSRFQERCASYNQFLVGISNYVPNRSDTQHREFNEEIGKVSVEAALSVTPDEWKADVFSSSLTFNGQAFFHAPGIVYTVELIVAVPAK